MPPITNPQALCLACSSSLPPKSHLPSSSSSGSSSNATYITPCCERPICPACLRSNPRLARYNPCLACLGGVGAVTGRNASGIGKVGGQKGDLKKRDERERGDNVNVDGAVRDEDVFVLGDDDEDGGDDFGGEGEERASLSLRTPPPEYSSATQLDDQVPQTPQPPSPEPVPEPVPMPSKYYLQKGDTLLGIGLRFGVDHRALCRLNNLPPSTLTTTPHILHTRTFITLPPSSKPPPSTPLLSEEETKEREARRAREKAEKRFQFVTKEVDWRVARAYVALADDPCEAAASAMKRKELGIPRDSDSKDGGEVEARAVDAYLEDEEWERTVGGPCKVQGWPVIGSSWLSKT
ncbi:hypothetical protein BD410DRAFT_784482 [Rickenella mellea]|uniref:LysM domain-containing protein n=1 Tax=Rickenella mellea TaxID=50990 RepID=A0A4Y7QEH9_9AGAM|nr:hypothetical protein BD410DRAFT_784482 [Rickenella mellea]